MKKFFFRILLFCIPLFSLFVLMEFWLYYEPNTFNVKANHLNENLGQIECLFLGSSHTDGAVKPEFMQLPASIMAHAAQDYQLDSALFFHYIHSMKKLKYLFIETDYHSLTHFNDKDAPRIPWYYRYHGIQIYPIKFLHRFSLFATWPTFFRNYISRKLSSKSSKIQSEQDEFAGNNSQGIFQELKYDEAEILRTAEKRLKKRVSDTSINNYNNNKRKIQSVIDYCLANNIQVVFLKTPIYASYRQFYNAEKVALRDRFIENEMQKNNSILLLDFEKDERFTVRDFANDDHLSQAGAEKLTRFINESILQHHDQKILQTKKLR